jgi:hypothetical protein
MPRTKGKQQQRWPSKAKRPKVLEQFYSSDAVLQLMVQALLEQVPECDIYIDPSAGDGALLRTAVPRSTQRLAFDIQPRAPTVQKCSFDSPQAQLSIERAIREFERRRGRRPRICVASNPPFKLIKRWLQLVEPWADWVMFLAPLQLQRLAYQDGIPPAYRLRWQQALPESQFLHDGELVARPTVLQVWHKGGLALQPLLPELGLPELGITQWRFAAWSEFRQLKAEKQHLLCFSAKTGQTWPVTRLLQQQGLQRCGISGSTKASQPTSVCRLIACRSKLVAQRLLVIGRLIERLALPTGGCTRESFRSTEFAWLWLKRYAPQTWELHCDTVAVSQLQLSPLDAFLFN